MNIELEIQNLRKSIADLSKELADTLEREQELIKSAEIMANSTKELIKELNKPQKGIIRQIKERIFG